MDTFAPIHAGLKHNVELIAEMLCAYWTDVLPVGFTQMLSRCESRMLPRLVSRESIFQLDLRGTDGLAGLFFFFFLEIFGIGS